MFSWLRMLARPEAAAVREARALRLEVEARAAKRLLMRALVQRGMQEQQAAQLVEMAVGPLLSLALQQALGQR